MDEKEMGYLDEGIILDTSFRIHLFALSCDTFTLNVMIS